MGRSEPSASPMLVRFRARDPDRRGKTHSAFGQGRQRVLAPPVWLRPATPAPFGRDSTALQRCSRRGGLSSCPFLPSVLVPADGQPSALDLPRAAPLRQEAHASRGTEPSVYRRAQDTSGAPNSPNSVEYGQARKRVFAAPAPLR